MSKIHRFTDGPAFARLASPFLRRHEAANNLVLRIVTRFADGAIPVPADVYLAVATAADMPSDELEPGDVVGVAVRTPPFPIVLGWPGAATLYAFLDDAVAFTAPAALSGVMGENEDARAFAAAYCDGTGATWRQNMATRVHELTRVELSPGPGELRSATEGERVLLHAWSCAFIREAIPHQAPPAEPPRPTGFYLWCVDGAPVTMVRRQAISPTTQVINSVYTPPELRRRGYATSAVSALSALCVAEGFTSCVLFTDLANPTSNAIYARVGYRPIADFLNLGFEPGEPRPT